MNSAILIAFPLFGHWIFSDKILTTYNLENDTELVEKISGRVSGFNGVKNWTTAACHQPTKS